MITSRVNRTLVRRNLVSSGDGILIGCSGGADSIAMAHVLDRLAGSLQLRLVVASIDHGLRPESADEVEQVRSFADSLGLSFRARRLSLKLGPDLQNRARVARYQALSELAATEGAARIAVGHSMDDQAETVLDRILRGGGLAGLGGVRPRRDDGVIRPLIDCRREDIRLHTRHHGLPVIEDPSNRDPRFRRVRIRDSVLPVLLGEDPQVVAHLAALADDARAAQEVILGVAKEALRANEPLDIMDLRALPQSVRRAGLRDWIEAQTGSSPRRSHIESMDDLLRGSDEVRLGHGWTARVEGSQMVLRRSGD